MRLWNEYEGLTITDAASGPLLIEGLIRPEGRSAFFSTRNGSNTPAVLRLIESIHDDDEILDRWKTVAGMNQPNLVAFKTFGHTVLEGTPIIYAVMEPTETSLATILSERALTLDETRQLAASLASALQSLHAANLVHEHIEPANVLATSDTVKLRGDCIRDIPSHYTAAEAQELRTRDVHDLALVLLQALTRHRNLADLGSTRLPAPFDQAIRNGIAGTRNLQQIAAIVTPIPAPAATPIPKPAPVPQPVPAAAAAASAAPVAVPAAMAPPPEAATPKPKLKLVENSAQARLPLAEHSPAAVAASIPRPIRPDVEPKSRITLPLVNSPQQKRLWLAAAAAVVILTLGWHFVHSSPAPDQAQPMATLADTAQPASQSSSATSPKKVSPNKPSAALTPQHKQTTVMAPSSTGTPAKQWRVVAFTYNRQDQAQHKAEQLAQQHNTLHPEVFTPTGRAPYLVTLGGPMNRDQALAFRDQARAEGLPPDIYAQNYTARSN